MVTEDNPDVGFEWRPVLLDDFKDEYNDQQIQDDFDMAKANGPKSVERYIEGLRKYISELEESLKDITMDDNSRHWYDQFLTKVKGYLKSAEDYCVDHRCQDLDRNKRDVYYYHEGASEGTGFLDHLIHKLEE